MTFTFFCFLCAGSIALVGGILLGGIGVANYVDHSYKPKPKNQGIRPSATKPSPRNFKP